MLTTEKRLQLQDIAQRIARREEVSFAERELIQKWADHHRTVYEMLRRAQREAFHGETEKTWIDKFLYDLNLGDPDPSTHRTTFDGPEDLGGSFKAPPWLRRD